MSTLLLLELADQIKRGLDRKAAKIPSRWSRSYVQITEPKTRELLPYSFRYHPWSKEIMDTPKSWVSSKAAQMAVTQAALIKALFEIDVNKNSVLYLLPKQTPDATDFSKDRFDVLINNSPYLADVFSDVNNVGHKRAGSASLYIRGMKSKSNVKSVPTPVVIFDEFDEMADDMVAQAEHRSAGQFYKQTIKFSTPTLPGKKIDAAYKYTTQEHYVFKCPHCGRYSTFVFPDALKVYTDDPADEPGLKKSHLLCEYGCAIQHEEKYDFLTVDKAFWRPTANPGADVRGFYINQFYSFTRTPSEIARDALLAEVDPAKEQEYWNSTGGKARIPKGAALTDPDIDACIGPFARGEVGPGNLMTMGVDVGKKIHFVIEKWTLPSMPGADLNTRSTSVMVSFGSVDHFEELDDLMREWRINHCVIDNNPETRKAQEFANRFDGYVTLCLYTKSVGTNAISENRAFNRISVDRTIWLDTTLDRFRRKKILLPKDIDKEFRTHMCAPVKRYGSDSTGNIVGRYINDGPDHYAHAKTYSEIALPIAAASSGNRDVAAYL